MQFDKPKVTIDLEEYQLLKEQTLALSDNDYLDVAKKIAWAYMYADDYVGRNTSAMVSTFGREGFVREYLDKFGIYITTSHLGKRNNTHECINIEFKSKK